MHVDLFGFSAHAIICHITIKFSFSLTFFTYFIFLSCFIALCTRLKRSGKNGRPYILVSDLTVNV